MDQEHNRAPALAADTEEERHEAMGRFAVLRPHLHDGVPLPAAARDAGVPLRSVPRWLAILNHNSIWGCRRYWQFFYGSGGDQNHYLSAMVSAVT